MKESKIKVNYVDFILVGLLIIVLASLISMFFSKSAIVDISSKETITVTVKIDNIKYEHKDLIKQNENVYIGDGDVSFGKIKSVKYYKQPELIEPSLESKHPFLIQNNNENLNDSKKLLAIIDIECQGLMDENVFETVNQSYSIGDVLDFCVYDYTSKASIINFNKE